MAIAKKKKLWFMDENPHHAERKAIRLLGGIIWFLMHNQVDEAAAILLQITGSDLLDLKKAVSKLIPLIDIVYEED